MSHRLLLVGKRGGALFQMVDVLQASDYDVRTTLSVTAAVTELRADGADAVVVDFGDASTRGQAELAQLRAVFPALPIVAVAPPQRSVQSLLQAGASDVVPRPLEGEALFATLTRVFNAQRGRAEQRQVLQRFGRYLEGMVGRSTRMTEVFERILRVAPSSAPVLVTGETGSGKELVAGAIHRASGRSAFVPINCGAIPAHLLESELFGHVRGAFTGAERDRRGLFEAADGGTLFLDEIAELPAELQPKLLRVLQSGEFRRVGEVEQRRSDVRLVAATHRDLRTEVANGRFREDLFFRINVLHVEVPPLRERPTDIPLLAERFLARFAEREGRPAPRIAPAALAALVAFPWPGNVRQLMNAVERAALFADGGVITQAALPPELTGPVDARRDLIGRAAERELTLAELEREYVLEILKRCGGNKSRAAQRLGLPRRTLYRRLEEYAAMT